MELFSELREARVIEKRLHGSMNYIPPTEFNRNWQVAQQAAESACSLGAPYHLGYFVR